ncbi:snare-complex protein syntaxin-18 N-terminus-domain-containing protein [Sordaria brevicollis]|uniref:Snare-complex protein syntaxin-18 N-terminus-domain-containing protein n=1 Tax=Sordaria brevicollis TaxID=83679 RepID=A0AAE0PHA4_SORBR|nr:snare-complex protein syntaxin-18 N-terminus-domain-containing protein [Sordaria brevicollis]
MADLTSTFNELLKGHDAPPTKPFTTDTADEFLKEAYRITSLVAQLHSELRNLRQAYLSTAAPRKTHLHTSARNGSSQPVYLTDRDREEIDANAKATLRDLNARIRALEDAEQLRQSTETALIQKKYARGLGALGSWAAGGGPLGSSKSKEHAAAEAVARQLGAHRESVIWYLRQRLQETARTQQSMMETRLTREMEKNRSVLAKARNTAGNDFGSRRRSGNVAQGNPSHLPMDEYERKPSLPTEDLTDEQIQMFEKGNQDMVKHFESTLDKVRAAEQSLLEISELQNMLVSNLTTQSAHIDQLVAESFETTEGVDRGNKELKKSTNRASPARYTFFAATGLCAFLVIWDLII